jgi:acetyl esterase/lipase
MELHESWLNVIDVKNSVFTKLINKHKIGIDLMRYDRLRKLSSLLRIIRHPKAADVKTVTYNGVRCHWIQPKAGPSDKIILAVHGGGYVLGEGAYCRFSGIRIAAETGCRTLAVDYRLAPEHPFPAALEDVYSVYTGLVDEGTSPDDIVLYGVSAGGGLCFSLCHMLKANCKPLPCAIVALSPAGNFTESGETHITKADKDPMFTKSLLGVRDFYAGCHDYSDPYLSPVLGDFAGFPPIRIYVGENEVLLSDSLLIGESASKRGVDVQVHLWKNMFHAFPIFGFILPEGRAAMREIVDYIQGLGRAVIPAEP